MPVAKTKTQSEIIPRLYMKLLPVQILLVIISGVNAIIDNVFAANLIGEHAMAVTGLFNPVPMFLGAVNVLIFGGAQVLCGKYLGKHMVQRTRSIFSLDISVMMAVSAILFVVCELFSTAIAAALGAKGDFVPDLASYIRGFTIGLPCTCFGMQFSAFLQLEHEEKRSYAAIVTMFATNILLDWMFVAVFDMGLFGLGFSTSIGNIIFCIIQGYYYFGKKAVIRFDRKCIIVSDIKDILLYGLPTAIAQFCIFIRIVILNGIIQRYVGTDGLSALSAINSFGCIYWCVAAGASSAVMVLGSVFAGEEDRTGLKILMKTFLTRGVGIALVATIVESALCYPFTNIFFHNPMSDVYKMTLAGFAVFPMYAPLSTIIVGFTCYYHCLSHESIVRTLSVTDGILGVCIISLLLVPHIGMMGIWLGQVLGSVFNVLVIVAYAYIYNRKPPINLERIMCFDEGFGVPDENRIDITVRSMEEVVNLSEKVWEFCEDHGLSGSRRNYSALCTEELAGNIVRHGFKNNKKNSIDIRVSYINDDIVICFKDDGIPFNPEEASRLFEANGAEPKRDADAYSNIGLHLVSRISKSMSYQNTFGLNVLTIVV